MNDKNGCNEDNRRVSFLILKKHVEPLMQQPAVQQMIAEREHSQAARI
jgi:hypothetical protein